MSLRRHNLLAAVLQTTLCCSVLLAQGTPAQSDTPRSPSPPKATRPGIQLPGVLRPINTITPQHIYPVDGTPDWAVITRHSVWVSSAHLHHVVQLLPSRGSIGHIVTIKQPCSGLAYGFGSVWVPSCGAQQLVRMSSETGRITAKIAAAPANSEGGIAIGDGAVWLVTRSALLIRVDPRTNAVVSRLHLPTGAENPAYGGGFLWISSSRQNRLLKIDPRRNRIVASIPVGPTPRFLTIGAGSVWILNQGDGTVSRISVASGSLLATIPCGIPGEGGEIVFGAGSVWVASEEFPLTQIDATTNRPVRQWVGQGGDGVRFGFGSVWLSNFHQSTVWQIDPTKL